MDGLDARILAAVTRRGRRLMTIRELEEEGANYWQIEHRVLAKRWQRIHRGVILIGAGALTWPEEVLAAALAADGPAVASHFTALRLYGLTTYTRSVEVSVRHETHLAAEGVTVHRTRRPTPPTFVSGIPCAPIEETLLDVAWRLPRRELHRLLTSAWRRRLTTPQKVLLHVERHGGRGVKGTRKLRAIASMYADRERGPGSDAEATFVWELLERLQQVGIEPPVLQFPIEIHDGTALAVVDFAWPERRKLVEMVGLEHHGDYDAQDYDTTRAAAIRERLWDLREVTPKAIRERPDATVRSLIRWLQTPHPFVLGPVPRT